MTTDSGRAEIADIYPLSPLQQGMLFHAAYEGESQAYFEQLTLTLRGPIRPELFLRALAETTRQDTILRTVFAWEGLEEPLQVVLAAHQPSFEYEDLRGLDAAKQEARIASVLQADRQTPFALAEEPAHRAKLLQLADDRGKLVFSFHHLLLDGWSIFLFLRRLLSAYESLCAGRTPLLPPTRPYRDYIALLKARTTDVESYFRRLLAGFDAPNHIEGPIRSAKGSEARREERSLCLSEEQTAALTTFARQHRLTLNTIVQGAWAILVGSYSNRNDVVFGVTFSTRPAELPDSEEMLGLFINTLPHRARLDLAKSSLDLLRDIQAKAVEIRAYDHTNLAQVQKWSEVSGGQPLFESLIVFENYAASNALGALDRIQVSDLDVRESTNYPLTLAVMPGASLRLRLQYDAEQFDAPFVDRMLSHLANVLEAMRERPSIPLGQLSLLSEQERHRLLVAWNETRAEYPRDAAIGQVFSAVARNHPDAIALEQGDRTLSYGTLERLANRLAHHLLERGVQPEEPIAIYLQRGTAFIVAALAILKAGGAYVPLDPSYPNERLAYMLKDARCRRVLGVKGELERLGEDCEAIDVDESLTRLAALPPGEQDEDPRVALGGDQLAYLIYTSGSTGRPKGVMVSHRGVLRIAMNSGFAPLGVSDAVAHLSNVSFDAATWEIWGALTNGARVAIFDKEEALSGELGKKLRARGVTAMFNTTALFNRIADDAAETLASLRHMLFGGELVDVARVQRVLERGRPERLLHVYGPTECVTYSSWHEIERVEVGASTVPIGRGVNNLRLYILDRNLNPAPDGVAGELYVAGEGLARGYQGDTALTASRFLPDPFGVEPDSRMYRTGDLARWNATGAIEFIGRADRQVKIRGFRIEPGEIEAVLRQHPAVRDAAVEVIVENGRKMLFAYAACPVQTTKAELRAFVAERLPDYMVPTGLLVMERLPITPNGKIDRKALPAPNLLPRQTTAARTDVERTLCAIWADLLRVPEVGIHDNYFELGGDSIITLAITSHAREAGISLTPKLLFQHPTIAALAEAIASRQVMSPAETSSEGSIPLTPIQRWFFELGLPELNHFAQTLHLELRRPVALDVLSRALAAVVAHHGALRLRFRQNQDGAWTQECLASVEMPPIAAIDLASAPDQRDALLREARALASSLDIGAGSLLRAALVRRGDGKSDALLVAIHHLAVDVVSWGILLADLERACVAAEKGESISFPPLMTSWKSWAEALSAQAHGDALLEELPYWQAQCSREKIPADSADGQATLSSRSTVTAELDVEATAALLTRANRAFDTRPLDLLLAAFARVMRRFTSSPSTSVLLERHGREEIGEWIDVSRTIGWFTAAAPIKLSASGTGDTANDIQSARDSLAAVPRGGLGYGMLRYLRGDSAIEASLAATPSVSFNYLGRAEGLGDGDAFRLIEEMGEASVSPNGIAPQVFDVVCAIKDEKLRVEWQFSEDLHARSTVSRLAGSYVDEIKNLVAHCIEASRARLPDTLGLDADKVEDAYPLSSLQEGLLFHERAAHGDQLYIEQIRLRLEGKLDEAHLEAALGAVVARHSALRTLFARDRAGEPLQIVVRDFRPILRVEDLAALEPQARAAAHDVILAAERSALDPFRAPPFRACVARLGPDTAELALTFHHVLLDGWSVSLVVNQLVEAYQLVAAGKPLAARKTRPYRDFIDWQRRSPADAEAFFREMLGGFDASARFRLPAATARDNGEALRDAKLHLDASAVTALRSLAQREHVTLNAVVQAAVALVLGRHLGTTDVVFGVTVAGRPHDIAGVEGMVGLFINTLPLRLRWQSESPISSLIAAAHNASLGLRQHEHASLAEVQRAAGVHGELFEALFVFENYPLDRAFLDAHAALRVVDVIASERTNYPLTVVAEPSEGLVLHAIHDARRLGPGFGAAFLDRLARVLTAMAESSNTRIHALPFLSQEERHRVLVEWNQTRAEYPRDGALGAVFSAIARQYPDAIAVEEGARSLSYGALDLQANRLAHWLLAEGLKPEEPVALCLPRSTGFVVAVLAILKASGAYVPLDPTYPDERLHFMLKDAGCRRILAAKADLGRFEGTGCAVVDIEDELDRATRMEPSSQDQDPGVAWGGDQLAYVMYTSGSTGRPKGAMISHRGVLRIALNNGFAQLGVGDVMAHISNVSFDAATWEIWGALLAGAKLAIFNRDETLGGQFGELLRQREVSAMFVTVALFNRLVDETSDTFATVTNLVVGGDALDPVRIRKALAAGHRGRLLNGYGPTECVTFSAWHEARDLSETALSVPIGRGVHNLRLYILDRDLSPAPIGLPGELYVAGDGIARGYAHNPGFSAARFLPDPFSAEPGSRMYRTGDIARWNADGVIEFVGRIDNQVKIRGFRVELSEIEAVLRDHPAVTDALVLAKGAGSDKRLVGYIAAPTGLDERAAREHLRGRLPDYMIPADLVVIDRLPVGPGGKVNRAALPEPTRSETLASTARPLRPIEVGLCRIFAEVLGHEVIGIHDDFFELGGHSLLATRIISRVRSVFQVDLPLRDLFSERTVARLATRVEALRGQVRLGMAEAIPLASREGDLPLSFGQQRIWFLSRMEEAASRAYHVVAAYQLNGPLDEAALTNALTDILARHESLRTVFPAIGGRPLQVTNPPEPFSIEIAALPSGAEGPSLDERLANFARRPFDLGQGPLVRGALLRTGVDAHVLVLAMHHIVVDGWSLGVFFGELAALYDAHRRGESSPLAPLRVHYADFAAWQAAQLDGAAMDRLLAYWKAELGPEPPVLELPTDKPRPKYLSYAGGHHLFRIPPALVEQVHSLARTRGVTDFMLLLAAFQVLLHRYTGQTDFAIGTPVAGRGHADVEPLIGFFVNTLVLRARLSGKDTFFDVLERAREATLGAYDHQDMPFERLVDALVTSRSLGRTPLCQVMFSVERQMPLLLAGVEATPIEIPSDTARMDWTLVLTEDPQGIAGRLEYNTDLFLPTTAARAAEHFIRLLDTLVQSPSARISDVSLLPPDERARVLLEWNRTQAEYPRDAAIGAVFSAEARKHPDAIALVAGEQAISYRELDQEANRLAHHLLERGATLEEPIGVCMQRGTAFVVTVLAILKAGGAYVPLDPSYPDERLFYMLKDAGCRRILGAKAELERLAKAGCEAIDVDESLARLAALPPGEQDEDPGAALGGDQLAYVMYTSGSTGRPKGAMISHRGVLRIALNNGFAQLGAGDVMAHISNVSFDAATWEIWGALLAGAKLAVFNRDETLSGQFGELLRLREVSAMFVTVALFNRLVDETSDTFATVTNLVVGGDALDPVRIRKALAAGHRGRLLNGYGPTECVTFSAWHDAQNLSETALSVPIGRGVHNLRLYILDRDLSPAPIGLPGELYVAGDGIARGYAHNPGFSAARFLPDPFSAEPGSRMYRTGDIARWNADGVIEFVGRIDNQVKIRGFRIEPGEIEAVLREHAAVKDAIVLVKGAGAEKHLVAYVAAPERLDEATLRAFLRGRLPDYMQPAALCVLDALPLSPGGKVDRAALPEPSQAAGDASVKPRDPVEESLMKIFAEVIEREGIGIYDNFFELGGHSLLATQVVSRVRKAFGKNLSLRTFFEAPTIAELAKKLSTLEGSSPEDGQRAAPSGIKRLARPMKRGKA